MFQNLLNLHRESAFRKVLINERKIAEAFLYRPSVLINIKKLYFPVHTDKIQLTHNASDTSLIKSVSSTSFSNRADVDSFQQKKASIPSTSTIESTISPFPSNEIDLTKLIRETNSNNP